MKAVDLSFNADIHQAAMTIAPLFKLFGWTWASAKYGVPTLDEIESHIREAVERLLTSDRHTSTSSGRITVIKGHDGIQEYIDIRLDLATLYESELEAKQ